MSYASSQYKSLKTIIKHVFAHGIQGIKTDFILKSDTLSANRFATLI